MLLFPQGFLKSLTYAIIASVMLSAILSITVLPAVLGMLGRHVDALGVRTLLRVPFLRELEAIAGLPGLAGDLLQKTKTREEVENGFWGKLVNRVMKRPLLFAVADRGRDDPADHSAGPAVPRRHQREVPAARRTRCARRRKTSTGLFPGYRTEPLTLVIQSNDHTTGHRQQVAEIRSEASANHRLHRQQRDNDPAERSWTRNARTSTDAHPKTTPSG